MRKRVLLIGASVVTLLIWLTCSIKPATTVTSAAHSAATTKTTAATTELETHTVKSPQTASAFSLTAAHSATTGRDVAAAKPTAISHALPVPLSVSGTLLKRMRITAIHQANAYSLAQLPTEVAVLLAELKLTEAQTLLEQVVANDQRGKQAANRLLASMWFKNRSWGICLPHTEFTEVPVSVLSMTKHEQLLRDVLRTVPPEVANRLANSQPIFEWDAVVTACSQLTFDNTALNRVFESASAGEDEDRLFIQRLDPVLARRLPPPPMGDDGHPRSPYSRAEMLRLQALLNRAWPGQEDGLWLEIKKAAVEAERYPELLAKAGEVLLMRPSKTNAALEPERAARYLELAAERGDLLALRLRGMQLLTVAAAAENGYVLSLFARHLNAIGCYPGDYLAEWSRTYRYVEEYAQTMSPVTLAITIEQAERYIATYGPKTYQRLYCKPASSDRD